MIKGHNNIIIHEKIIASIITFTLQCSGIINFSVTMVMTVAVKSL